MGSAELIERAHLLPLAEEGFDIVEVEFVLEAVGRALSSAQPVICNSDQGSHFTSPQYISLLEEAGIMISMDGKGRAIDNVLPQRDGAAMADDQVRGSLPQGLR